MTEQSISESEERPLELIQSEYQKYIKKKQKMSRAWEYRRTINKRSNICLTRIWEEKKFEAEKNKIELVAENFPCLAQSTDLHHEAKWT